MKGFMMHCGGRKATLDEVRETKTPLSTRSHFPIPHSRIVDLVTDSFVEAGYEIQDAQYALRGKTGDAPFPDAQFFGLFHLRNGSQGKDYDLVAGLRNSHDKSVPAAIALGSHVFVCDNMAFSGEVKLARKHTRFILRDLPGIVAKAVGELGNLRNRQAVRIEAYKGRVLSQRDAYTGIVKAYKSGIVPSSKVGHVVAEWDRHDEISETFKPRHEEFVPRNAWSLFNCFTEVLKGYPLDGYGTGSLQDRTQRLHGLMDLACQRELATLAN